jgi:hypothetical protein
MGADCLQVLALQVFTEVNVDEHHAHLWEVIKSDFHFLKWNTMKTQEAPKHREKTNPPRKSSQGETCVPLTDLEIVQRAQLEAQKST